MGASPCCMATWAPAFAGVTLIERDSLPTNVMPAEAGTQHTELQE